MALFSGFFISIPPTAVGYSCASITAAAFIPSPSPLTPPDIWCLECEAYYCCIAIRKCRSQDICTRFFGTKYVDS